MSKPDKTGAPTTVTAEPDRYTIAVEGKKVGKAEFTDRGEPSASSPTPRWTRTTKGAAWQRFSSGRR